MAIGRENTEQPPQGVLIPFSDDDERQSAEADEDPDEPGLTDDVRRTRRARRSERTSARLKAGEEAQALAVRLENENRQLANRLARLEGAHIQLANQSATPPVDPYEARLKQIEDRRDFELRQAQAEVKAGTYTPERDAHFKKLGDDLDRERVDILFEKKMAQRDPQLLAQVQSTVAQNQWQMQYPDVYSNDRARAWAFSRKNMLVAEGKQDSVQLNHDVLREAQEKFNLTPKEKPSQSLRSKLSGHPASGASTEAGPGTKGGGIVMTKELSRIARARFPGLKGPEADKKWAQTIGKRMREKGEL